jgi:hypothetical protein
VAGRRYETIEDLHAYGARVAGAVGLMMALVMETRERSALARACELGVAMQLTNIARDVGEDARMGRSYLPRRTGCAEAGLEPQACAGAACFSPALAGVVARLLRRGRAPVPPRRRAACRRCRATAARASRRPGSCTARSVTRWPPPGLDSVSRRAVVSRQRQLALVGRAMVASIVPPGHPVTEGASQEPLEAVRFLVDAACSDALPQRTFYQRTVPGAGPVRAREPEAARPGMNSSPSDSSAARVAARRGRARPSLRMGGPQRVDAGLPRQRRSQAPSAGSPSACRPAGAGRWR